MDFVIQYVLEIDTSASAFEMSLILVQEQMSAVQVLGKVQDVFADDPMPLFPGDNNPMGTVIASDHHDKAPVLNVDNGN